MNQKNENRESVKASKVDEKLDVINYKLDEINRKLQFKESERSLDKQLSTRKEKADNNLQNNSSNIFNSTER